MLRVESETQDFLLQGRDTATGAETAEFEGFPAATRKIAPAVAGSHEIREFLGGNVVHLGKDVEPTHMGDKYLFLVTESIVYVLFIKFH